MKVAAIVLNAVLFVFTCLVIATDGPPKDVIYVIFTAWALLTMILNALVLLRIGTATMRAVAILCNIVFFGFVCWAIVDQYPHPEEEGFIPFVVMMVLTPLLSLVALFRSGAGNGWLGLHMKAKALEEHAPKAAHR